MLAQMLAHGLAQRPRAEAVDDAHRLLAFEQGAVEELVGGVQRVVDAGADEIELRANLRVSESV